MRVLITASGIQDYIFSITEHKASARLRGRSARLGLVMHLCLLRLQEKFGDAIEVKRNAGSRLEVEITPSDRLDEFVRDLRGELDDHSRSDLNGDVWFAIGYAADQKTAFRSLGDEKLSAGKATLQRDGAWDPEKFVFERWPSERAMQNPDDADATKLPEAVFGRDLVDSQNRLITFCPAAPADEEELRVLNYAAKVQRGQVYGGIMVALQDKDGNTIQQTSTRLARYAPTDDAGYLLDLDKIADNSTGAQFLGVLKADLDGLGETFKGLNEEDTKRHSERLETLFTEDLESLIRSKEEYGNIYVVYSGGDDLFLLGPWDKLIRFIDEFHSQIENSVKDFKPAPPTLSAGFKLAHSKSPVRFLAVDVEAALDYAKGRIGKPAKLAPKNRLTVFERVIAWDELHDGLAWADQFILGVKEYNLSRGFLQRLQYYGDQLRQFFDQGKVEGLRAVPLLQDDWRRNIARVKEPLQKKLKDEIQPRLAQPGEHGERMWRVIEFASRFAIYALH